MCPKPNITKEDAKALEELRQDEDRVMLTIDKEMALEVLDRQDYINRVMDHLAERGTYRPLTSHPTNTHKTDL